MLKKTLGVLCKSVYCTKIASKLSKNLYRPAWLERAMQRVISILEYQNSNKSSDWGRSELSKNQITYAANDVLYLC